MTMISVNAGAYRWKSLSIANALFRWRAPDHFKAILADGGNWICRIGGLRANASRLSHAELDVAEELDDGDPVELGRLYRALSAQLPNLTVVGGCCGTDHRHLEQICRSLDAT